MSAVTPFLSCPSLLASKPYYQRTPHASSGETPFQPLTFHATLLDKLRHLPSSMLSHDLALKMELLLFPRCVPQLTIATRVQSDLLTLQHLGRLNLGSLNRFNKDDMRCLGFVGLAGSTFDLPLNGPYTEIERRRHPVVHLPSTSVDA